MMTRYAFLMKGGRLATAGGRVIGTRELGRALGAAVRGGAVKVVELRWSGAVWYAAGEIVLPRGGRGAGR